jgi:hypothetical protein
MGTLAVFAAACGGSAGSAAPGTKSATDVASNGMSQSFAGQNKCNPKNADRPFIIEWDATDMSSFESRAANDVIFVKYEGCDLKVIDSCVNDSVKGSFGSYKPVEWTSGSLEALDINNSGDLYAKLPLGAASLGGRVEGGEKFHMEYFVSGTRTATRDTIYRGDLASVKSCKGATHFVYAYNLGAFALGAQSNLKASVGGSAFGFGAGGDRSSSSKADKQGGLLSSCRTDSASEVQSCKVPIRLTLHEITEGQSDDATAAQAPDTPDAMNLAGKLQATTKKEHDAADHADTARTKMSSRDGAGCLAELDQHDKLDPRPIGMSTNSGSYLAVMRGQCLMLAGKCDAGKQVYRKALEKMAGANMDASQLDKGTDAVAGMNCQGGSMSPRDQLQKASMELQNGAFISKKTSAQCQAAYDVIKRVGPTVKPRDDDDATAVDNMKNVKMSAPRCFAHAGDCDSAIRVMKEQMPNQSDATIKQMVPTFTNKKCSAP